MINKFADCVIIGDEIDDGVNALQFNGYGTCWTPPQGDNSNKVCTTEFIKNNLSSGITYSTSEPVNPDTNPQNKIWMQVSTSYPRTVVDMFIWDGGTGKWDILTYKKIWGGGRLSGSIIIQKTDGSIWVYGNNTYGELGLNKTTPNLYFTKLVGFDNPRKVVIGSGHIFIEKSDGTVWRSGRNHAGQLGNGTTTSSSIFIQLSGFDNPRKIRIFEYTTYIEKSDGTVWVCGDNSSYQNGLGGVNWSGILNFTNLPSFNYPINIVGGDRHILIHHANGTVYACGYGAYGTNCDGTGAGYSVFTLITQCGTPTKIDAGFHSSFITKSDGSVWACGRNWYGELGIGSAAAYPGATLTLTRLLPELEGYKKIISTEDVTYVIKADNSVVFIGKNDGQVGTNNYNDSITPVNSPSFFGASDIFIFGWNQTFVSKNNRLFKFSNILETEITI